MKEITFEENASIPERNTLTEVWTSIWNNPQQLFTNWNYKTAIFSGLLRAPIFLAAYLLQKESWKIALGAAAAQFLYRFLSAGVIGALIQAFRRVEPAWKALVTVMLLIPAITHFFEFVVQYLYASVTATANHTQKAIIGSICFSIISALFNLFAMRRDVMIVGEAESKTMWGDIKHIPVVVFLFMAIIPMELARRMRRGAWMSAIFGIVSFGGLIGLMAAAIRGKWAWLMPWATGASVWMIVTTAIAVIYLSRRKRFNQV